jgi:hypothetical protein
MKTRGLQISRRESLGYGPCIGNMKMNRIIGDEEHISDHKPVLVELDIRK